MAVRTPRQVIDQVLAWFPTNNRGAITATRQRDALFEILIETGVVAVTEYDVNDPPLVPTYSDSFIVGTVPTGDWLGQGNKIAYISPNDGSWLFYPSDMPLGGTHDGLTVWVKDINTNYSWDGSAWIPDSAGGGGSVTSVFGRTGAIVAVAGDYAASEVSNDSGVVGTFVDDALDTLDAEKVDGAGAIAAVGGALLDTSTINLSFTLGQISADIIAGSVNNNLLATMATARLKGRVTAGTGAPEDLTGTQATTLLDVFTTSLKGIAPASGGGIVNFLRADGTWATPSSSGTVPDADYGDITVSGTGTIWTIDPNVVTFAKMQQIATDSILGRDTAGTGNVEQLSLNATLSINGGALQREALTGDITAAAGSNVTVLATVNSDIGTFGSGTQVPQLTVNGKGLITGVTNINITGIAPPDGDKGDIVVTGSGATWTIDTNVVTFAKFQQITSDRLLGRDTAGTGNVEEISLGSSLALGGLALVRAALTGDITAAQGSNATTLATVNANVGTFGSATQVSQVTVNGKGLVTAASNVTISGVPAADGDYGDVVVSGAGTVWTIDTNVVTFAKFQQIATDTLLGRDTAGTGDIEQITLNATLSMTGAGALQRAAIVGDIGVPAGSNSSTLATVNPSPGVYGSATQVPVLSVSGKGLVTASANTNIAIPSSQVTNFVEAAQDAVGAMVGISLIYDDSGTTLQRAALTGDITAAQDSNAMTLATVNANVGTFGSVTQTVTFTVNGKGLITAAAHQAIAIPSTQVTDFAEASQDATGAMVGTSIVYNDAGPTLQRAALTGDITAAQDSNTTTLATVNANVGTFGSATQTVTFTVNGKGLLTASAQQNIAIPASQVTDFNEASQDAIGTILVDSSSIDFTYDDTIPSISAVVKPASITGAMLVDDYVNTSGDTMTGGLQTINGSASTPAVHGSTANTGIFFGGAAEFNITVQGVEVGVFVPTGFQANIPGGTSVFYDLFGEGAVQFRQRKFTADAIAPLFSGSKGRGTIAAPALAIQDDVLVSFTGNSWIGPGATTFSAAFELRSRVIQPTPSATAQESEWEIFLNAVNAIARTTHLRGSHAEGLVLRNGVIFDTNRLLQLRTSTEAGKFTGVAGKVAYFTDNSGGMFVHDTTSWKRSRNGGSQTIALNTDFTLTPNSNAYHIRQTTALTADRTVTLAAGRPGDEFWISRPSTGSFNLIINTTVPVNLATGGWAYVVCDSGSAWRCAAQGTGAN